jgi:DNA-binding transcriptional MerR regulator
MSKGRMIMEEALITKKELLELTGISYGALYRWKRKNLIPDDWFIHRATFTGQETFFPREKILERIEKIKQLKDTMSLDDIAETFNPKPREVSLTQEEAERYQIAARSTLELYIGSKADRGPFSFGNLIEVYLLEKLLNSCDIERLDALSAAELAGEILRSSNNEFIKLVIYRKHGVAFCLIAEENNIICSDKSAKMAISISLSDIIAELKQILDRNNH